QTEAKKSEFPARKAAISDFFSSLLVDPVGEPRNQKSPNIILNHPPHVWALADRRDTRFDLINKIVAQTSHALVVVLPGRNELRYRFSGEPERHPRNASRTRRRASSPSTNSVAPDATLERRRRISSKCARWT